MELNIQTVEMALKEAAQSNPGACLRGLPFGKEIRRCGNTVRHPPGDNRQVEKILEIKELFEEQIGCSVYTLLPGVVENSFR